MTDEQGNVVVVGGAGGIGTAVVTRYLERGVGVAVVDIAEARVAGGPFQAARLRHILADVTQTEDLARAHYELSRLDRGWAHLVSMAGGALEPEFRNLTDTDVQTIRSSIELNLTSHVLLIREFLPLLGFDRHSRTTVATNRSITLVSSINALRDYGLPAYSAAKAGMLGLVRAMASELGARGIRVNAVVPGTVVTDSSNTQPKDYEALRRSSALGRLATPEDVSDVILAVSHTMTAVTGQHFVVDCGQTVATADSRRPKGRREESSP
jgi:3-oxoacyl-[acyl-carrier protein] reductase